MLVSVKSEDGQPQNKPAEKASWQELSANAAGKDQMQDMPPPQKHLGVTAEKHPRSASHSNVADSHEGGEQLGYREHAASDPLIEGNMHNHAGRKSLQPQHSMEPQEQIESVVQVDDLESIHQVMPAGRPVSQNLLGAPGQ